MNVLAGVAALMNHWMDERSDAFVEAAFWKGAGPIDMVLFCPSCGKQHIDAPEPSIMAMDGAMFGGDWPGRWTNPPHRSHLCFYCHHTWRPADVPTNGVQAVKTKGHNDSSIPREPFEYMLQVAEELAFKRGMKYAFTGKSK